jgi:hypothetical protein
MGMFQKLSAQTVTYQATDRLISLQQSLKERSSHQPCGTRHEDHELLLYPDVVQDIVVRVPNDLKSQGM